MKCNSILYILSFFLLPLNPGFAQILTKLHDFDNVNGAFSRGNELITDGTYFYGMSTFGGIHNEGTIYKIKIDGTGFEKLHDFDGTNGAEPYNSLTLIGSGLYGTTFEGGANNWGIVFRINTDGSNYTKLIDFSGGNGQLPQSTLFSDGSYLYGTTYGGGQSAGGGTIFKIKPDGTDFEVIYSFNGSTLVNGSQPNHGFLWDESTSYLYGTTFLGGTNLKGVIYRIKKDGTGFEKLHDFDGLNGDYSGELMLHDGYLYGCTLRGGANEKGIIYKLKTDGTDFVKLHDFESMTGGESLNRLIFMDDYLYGTAIRGGEMSGGVIFRIKTDGSEFANIFTFGNDSGYSPWSSMLAVGSDFYGITEGGGTHGYGTIYKFDPDGVLSNIEATSTDFNLFPNPATNNLYVLFNESQKTDIKIYDLSGKLILKQLSNGTEKVDLNISSLKSGVYTIQVGDKSMKFIKK